MEPANQFLRGVAAQLGLSSIRRVGGISDGARDLSLLHLIASDQGRYVLKQFQDDNQHSQALKEPGFAAQLARAGFESLARASRAIYDDATRSVWVLYPYIAGPPAHRNWTDASWERAGRLLARYHRASARLLQENSDTILPPHLVETLDCDRWVVAHGDFRADNLLVVGKEFFMVDFEFRKAAPATFDLAMMLAYRSRPSGFEIASAQQARLLVSSYIEEAAQDDDRLQALSVRSIAKAGVCVYRWLAGNLTRGGLQLAQACEEAARAIENDLCRH